MLVSSFENRSLKTGEMTNEQELFLLIVFSNNSPINVGFLENCYYRRYKLNNVFD